MMKRLGVAAVIFFLLVLTGCGRKTPAVPPQAVIAQAISDLRSQLDDQAVTLTWTYPRLSINNERIDNIRSFTVAKAQIPAKDYCSGCPVVYDYQFEVDADGLKPGDEVRFRDSDLAPGYHYVYMVRAKSGWRILSKPSNRISFGRKHVLLPPTDLQVASGDSRLTLSWAQVEHRADGSLVTGLTYQIYRSLDNKKFLPLGLPTGNLSYIDPGLINGRTYFYQVRAVQTDKGVTTLGQASQTAIGIPVDMTAPAPPTDLVLIVRQHDVQLHWQASPSSDVAGYHIYRQDQGGPWQRIATTKAGAISYTDRSGLPRGTSAYRITAFDKGVRQNESEPTPTVSSTKQP